jgi:AbrB family looped-hinge helix DNA binding protein
MIATTVISGNGQIAIPKSIQDQLHLVPGTHVTLDVQGDRVVIARAPSPDWRSMRGMFRHAGNLLEDLTAERNAERAHDDSRLKGI